VAACVAPAGHVAVTGDCDDARNDVYPGAAELCDLVDNDCDAEIDEDVGSTFYRDGDADGYGVTADAVIGCVLPEGYALQPDDCNDELAGVHPGATEICDEIDNDCDGFVDEEGAFLFYRDVDADGHGDGLAVTQGCRAPDGFVTAGDDCPDAPELCDGIDNDCDLAVDEDNQVEYFRDADGDGFGDGGVAQTSCQTHAGWVTNADDCDDAAGAVNPGAEEICDGVDNDCDGNIDGDTCRQCDATTLGVLAGNARYGLAYVLYQGQDGTLGICSYRGNHAGNAFVLDEGCGCDAGQVIDARWVTMFVATLPWYGTTRASATLLPPGCE
jgi:Putative metal-binding motif